MDKLQELQERVDFLEKENEYLKSLLDKAGILYASTERAPVDLYEPDQGARIIHKDITSEDANKFFSMFWGRTDVYSKRTIKKSTGEVNYYTQCYNFWRNGCPRMNSMHGKVIILMCLINWMIKTIFVRVHIHPEQSLYI